MQYAAASEWIFGVNKFNRAALSPRMFVQLDLECGGSPSDGAGEFNLNKLPSLLHLLLTPSQALA